MAVVAEDARRRTRSLTSDLAIVGRSLLIGFSVSTLAMLQFLTHSAPSNDIVYTPTRPVIWAFELLILLPAFVYTMADAALSVSDPTGNRVRRLRTVAFAVALVLVMRQFQLYFGPARSFFDAWGPAEVLLFLGASAGIVYAVVRWQDGFRQFFQAAAPVALIMLVLGFAQVAPGESAPSGYAATTPAGNPDNPPVFVIVADELSYMVLSDGEAVDAESFPNIAELAGDSAWLTNATTNFIHTNFVVPRFFESTTAVSDEYQLRLYDQYAYVESLAWDQCGTVFTCRGAVYMGEQNEVRGLGTILRRAVYQVTPGVFDGLLRPATSWLQGGLDAPAPNLDRLGMHTYTNQGFETLMADLNGEEMNGRLHFYHLLLPHTPFVYNRDGSIVSEVSGDTTFERYTEQTRFLDAQIGRLIERLKAEGVYDDAVLILTGDHGIREHTVEGHVLPDEPLEVTNNVAQVPFLVKAPGVAPGEYDVDYQHMDFAATLMDVIDGPAPAEGVSAFSDDRPVRDKVFYVDDANEFYWRYVYDPETGEWTPVEFVNGPIGDTQTPSAD